MARSALWLQQNTSIDSCANRGIKVVQYAVIGGGREEGRKRQRKEEIASRKAKSDDFCQRPTLRQSNDRSDQKVAHDNIQQST